MSLLDDYTRTNATDHCPICSRDHFCLISNDRNQVICTDTESNKRYGDAGWLHVLSDASRPEGYEHPSHKKAKQRQKKKPDRTDWPDVAQALTDCPQSYIDALAEDLMVPQWAIQKDLAVGHGSIEQWKAHKVGQSTSAYCMPERSADGTIIGLNRRFPEKWCPKRRKLVCDKKQAYRGPRGLTFAADWQSRKGPILVVEGFTDTAAAHAMGLAVIGRPGAAAGSKHLIELLRDVDKERQIIIVGDRDEKKQGEKGAKQVTSKLAEELDRVIHWSFPPENANDTRTWLNKCDPQAHTRERGELDALGLRYLGGLDAISVRPDRPTVERFEPPKGSLVPLVDYRKQMVDAREQSIGKPGVSFDRGPTGVGKSTAWIEVYPLVDRSLNLQKTHANCAEEAEKLQAAGLDAKAIPQMNKYTCKNFKEADNALKSGLSARAAVCPTCDFNSTCGYLADSKEAQAAAITIVTHARAAKQLPTLADGFDLVVMEEDPIDLLRPTLSVNPETLYDVAAAAQEAKGIAINREDDELFTFLHHMEELADNLLHECQKAKTTRAFPLPAPIEKPKNLEKQLWRVIKLVVSWENNLNQPVNPEAMQLIIGILTGSVVQLVIDKNKPFIKNGGGEREVITTLVGVSRTELPQDIPIWNQDATGNAKDIGDLIGQAVNDCTPKGRLANQKAIKQYPIDFTQKTKPAKAAAYIEGLLQSIPNAKKVGLILHQAMRIALFGPRSKQHPEEYLTEAAKKRIHVDGDGEHLAAHFGSGLERASNQWLDKGCDSLLILGTYRVNPIADKVKLIQFGKITAAADPQQGGWGKRRWEGRTAAGQPIQVDGLGYSDPDWRKAREHTCRSTLLQAIGRGRGILDAGIPVHIFSTEPLGPDVELVDPADMRVLKRATLEAVEAVRGYCATPITTIIRDAQYPAPVQTKQIAGVLGKSTGHTSRILQQAESAGLITRSEAQKGGWLPVPLREHTIREAPADPQKIPRPPAPPARPPAKQYRAAELAAAIPGVSIAADLEPADTS